MSTYQELFRDPRWQKKRLKIFERDDWTCTRCTDDQFELHIHHLKYVKGRKPWEYSDDQLTTYCVNCHTQFHLFEKCTGIVCYWAFFDDILAPIGYVTWSGKTIKRGGDYDDEYICHKPNGKEIGIPAGCGTLFLKPDFLLPSMYESWMFSCMAETERFALGTGPTPISTSEKAHQL